MATHSDPMKKKRYHPIVHKNTGHVELEFGIVWLNLMW